MCQKVQKLIALLVALCMAFCLSGCIEITEEPNKVGEVDVILSPSPEANKTQTFSIGDVVEVGGVAVTLLSAKETTGNGMFVPDAGYVFMICTFEIENKSSDEVAISSMMSFEAYVDDYSTAMDLSATVSVDDPQLDGSIAAGKKMKGVIGYQIPSDWAEMEVHFTPSVWNSAKAVFKFSK